MKHFASPEFWFHYRRLPENVRDLADKNFALLKADPRHPSLRFKKVGVFVYAAEIQSGELKIDDESKEAAWVPLSSAVELPLAERQRRMLKDAMEYQKKHRPFLR